MQTQDHETEFYLITCVSRADGDISHVTYRALDVTFDSSRVLVTQVEIYGEANTITLGEAVRAIQRGGWQFWVYAGERLTMVEVVQRDGRSFLRTTPDDTALNNLSELPECEEAEDEAPAHTI